MSVHFMLMREVEVCERVDPPSYPRRVRQLKEEEPTVEKFIDLSGNTDSSIHGALLWQTGRLT